MVSILQLFEYLEDSDTKNDLRNGFFSKNWSYDNKGFSIRTFVLIISSLAFARHVSEHESRECSNTAANAPLKCENSAKLFRLSTIVEIDYFSFDEDIYNFTRQ